MAISRALLALTVLLVVAAPAARACVGLRAVVTNTGTKPAQPSDPQKTFDVSGVTQHFQSLLPTADVRSNAKSTYSCVDSRGTDGQLGTLGGDIAELATAIVVYLKSVGAPTSGDVAAPVKEIFNAFMAQIATKERPFYFHTSDEKLNKIFSGLAEEYGVSPKPTAFPKVQPVGAENVDHWLKKLTTGKYQGCGHVRLMIDQFADYGLDSPAVPQALIKAFFEYWWPTPVGSEERSKIQFKVLQGPLDGKAIAIVDATGNCPGKTPAATPSHDGSQLFVYHAKAVEELRAQTIAPFFAAFAQKQGKPFDQTKFTNDLKTLQAKHLGATLTYLAPANSLQLFSVSIDVNDPNAPPAPATSTAPNAANAAKPSTAPNAANAAKPSTAPNAANAAKPSTAPNAANAAKPSTAPNAANAAQLNARNLPIYTADGTPKPTTP